MLVLPTPCVVLPAGQRLQRSAALLLSGAKLGRNVPLEQRTRSVEPAAGARQPGGTKHAALELRETCGEPGCETLLPGQGMQEGWRSRPGLKLFGGQGWAVLLLALKKWPGAFTQLPSWASTMPSLHALHT